MTALLSAYWMALLLPGYALVKRFDPRALDGGILSGVALGYLASFVLLTPVSVACYLFRLPLAVFSGAIVLAAVAGAFALGLQRRRESSRRRLDVLAIVVGIVILADLVLSSRAGSHLGGDAGYHIARVRTLLDHGFNNWDPLVSGGRFDNVYHTNIYHALLASSAQLTQTSAGAAWVDAFAFAKLVSIAGTFQLTYALCATRWVAWISALVAVVWLAPYTVLTYPNTLAPHWLLALGFACGARTLIEPRGHHGALWLGACALALAQVHALYAIFLWIALSPTLALALVWKLLREPRHREGHGRLIAALLALCLGIPWSLTSTLPKLKAALTDHTQAPASESNATAGDQSHAEDNDEDEDEDEDDEDDEDVDPGFVRLDGDMLMVDPSRYFHPEYRFTHLFLLLTLGLFTRERRRFAPFFGVALTTCVLFFLPPVTTAIVDLAGAGWVLLRMRMIFVVLTLALVPAAVFWLLEPMLTRRLPALIVRGMCVVLAGAYGWKYGVDGGAWTRQAYFALARNGRADNAAQKHARLRKTFSVVPQGALIAAPLQHDYYIITHCDCHPLAFRESRGKHGVGDIAERRRATAQLYDDDTSPEERLAILERYRVRHVYATNKRQARILMRGVRERVTEVQSSGGARVLVFDLGERR